MAQSVFQKVNEHAEEFSDEAQPLPTITADNFLLKPAPKRQMLLDEVLPLGEVGLLVAASSTGKSYFSAQLSISVATGLPVCGGLFEVATQGSVLIFAAEDDIDEIHRRMEKIVQSIWTHKYDGFIGGMPTPNPTNAELTKMFENIHIVPLAGQKTIMADDDDEENEFHARMLATAKQISNLKLVIIDPLRRFIAGDENNSETATWFIVAAERIAKETGATVLGIHHVSKAAYNNNKAGMGQFDARGSSAFTDLVRWQMNMSRLSEKDASKFGIKKEDCYKYIEIAVTKNNYSPPQKGRLFLERMEGGVLRYVILQSNEESTMEDLLPNIIGTIKSEYKAGKVYGRTEFIKEFGGVENIFKVGEKRLTEALKKVLETNILETISKSDHKGKGKVPMIILPKGKIYPPETGTKN